MRTRKRILWSLLIALAALYVVPAVSLQIPCFQDYVAGRATRYLESKIGTRVQVGRVSIHPFNQLILKEVYLEDRQGDTLLSAKRLAAGFDFLPLFKKQFHFRSLHLHTFSLHLNKTSPKANLNIQYIIDAFQSDAPVEDPLIDLHIKSLSLRGGSVSYHVESAEATPDRLDPNHLFWHSINGKIRLNGYANDSLSLSVLRLKASEQSGLRIEQVAFNLFADSLGAVIPRLDVRLPHSTLRLTDVATSDFRKGAHRSWAETGTLRLQIEPSQVHLADLSALLPILARGSEAVEVQGAVSGRWSDLSFKEFRISAGRDAGLAFDAEVRNLGAADRSRIFLQSRIHDSHVTAEGMERIVKLLDPDAEPLSEPVRRLRSVALNGNVSGQLNNLTAAVRLQAAGVGDLRADVNFGRNQTYFLNGKLATTGIDLQPLTADSDWGSTRFEAELQVSFSEAKDFAGAVTATVNELDYKGYRYENLDLSGHFTKTAFEGSLHADSPDGRLFADGEFRLQGPDSRFEFSVEATDLLIDRLGWTQKYAHPKLSFALRARFMGNDADNVLGLLALRDLRFSHDEGSYALDRVVIQSIGIDQEKQLAIHSDLLSGRMEGRFSFRTLTDAARRTMGVYLPSVASPMEAGADSTHFTWALTVNDTQELSSVLKLPLTVYEPSFIHGEYRTADNHIRLNGHFPLLQFKALTIENGTIAIANPNDALEIRLSADQQLRKGDPIQLSATLRAENDSIRSSIRWNDDALAKTRGILDFTSHLSLAEGPNSLAALIRLEPSEMVFNDSVWTISPALAKYSEGRIDINSLEARHNNQRIAIAGIASKDTTDRLRIALDAVNLDYIFQSLAIRSLTFGGIATGYVTANDLFTDERKMETHLDVQNFSFNNTAFGDLNLDGAWNEKEKSVEMLGKTARNDSTYVRIDGQIFPYKQEISFHFDAHRGNAAFLRKYINNIARDLTGQITGQIHLFGHWNDPTVEGIVRLDDASFGIDFLNARYSFSDTIRMTPTQISVQDLTLFDQNGNTANVTGAVDHTLLQNFSFSAQLKIENNFLIYAATPQTNPTFFGKAYASGTGSIKGNEKDINIEMTLQNNDNTDLTFNFMEQSPVADYDFINFLPDSSTLTSTPSTPPTPAPASPINILTKLTLTATPAATVTILINPATGDKITASGEGNIGITFGNRTDPHINGTYNITRGAYNFSFQQALTILFNIEENSKVSFRGGGPLDAILDIKASHEVSANLSDLDRQLTQPTEGSSSGSRDNILVKCILILTKELQHPTISFDLELPGPNAEYEQQLKNYIRTPDALNRQIAYLLLMKRFYKAPEYARNDARTNDELSLLISAIPSYILSLLGNVSDKLHVDTKFRQTYENGETNTEMELRLSSNLLKNRLIINGNFGYINNPTLNALNDNAPIIGDFDVEYMLTKNGNIRLKGFNRYNYRNYYSLTPEMTQGLGILFRRDFNTLNDLFFRPLRPKPADKTE